MPRRKKQNAEGQVEEQVVLTNPEPQDIPLGANFVARVWKHQVLHENYPLTYRGIKQVGAGFAFVATDADGGVFFWHGGTWLFKPNEEWEG